MVERSFWHTACQFLATQRRRMMAGYGGVWWGYWTLAELLQWRLQPWSSKTNKTGFTTYYQILILNPSETFILPKYTPSLPKPRLRLPSPFPPISDVIAPIQAWHPPMTQLRQAHLARSPSQA